MAQPPSGTRPSVEEVMFIIQRAHASRRDTRNDLLGHPPSPAWTPDLLQSNDHNYSYHAKEVAQLERQYHTFHEAITAASRESLSDIVTACQMVLPLWKDIEFVTDADVKTLAEGRTIGPAEDTEEGAHARFILWKKVRVYTEVRIFIGVVLGARGIS